MLRLRVTVPTSLSESVVEVLQAEPAVSSLVLHRGAARLPEGDLIEAECPREVANDLVERLRKLGVHRAGTLSLEQVRTWASERAWTAERSAPGSGADSVVWAEVTHQAYDDAELNWVFLTFMALATVLAGIAIALDSQILLIGSMVLGPEFGAIAALGVGLVRQRGSLLLASLRALAVGFTVGIVVATVLALAARAVGWIELAQVDSNNSDMAFIYTPDKWSAVVAIIAAVAGVLSTTSARLGGLSGVFISVTTIPAAANVALGLAFGLSEEFLGSLLQLGTNLVCMAVAGALTLEFQQRVWTRIAVRRSKAIERRRHREVFGSDLEDD